MVVLRLLRCVVVLFSVWRCAALAQQPSMAGRVGDETGGGLPGVSVQAASTDGKTTRIVTTNETGHYQFESLPAGRYDVTFSEMNFASVRRRNVIVPATGAGPRVDAILQVALSAQVVVTGLRTFRNLADLDRPSENLVGVAGAASEGAVTGAQIAARPIMRSAKCSKRCRASSSASTAARARRTSTTCAASTSITAPTSPRRSPACR